MIRYAGIDFETYSNVDLPKHGLYNYVHGEDFQPLMADINTEEFGTEHYDFILEPESVGHFKARLQWLITYGYKLVAHNAGFERAVLKWMGLNVSHHVIDSAVHARMVGAGESLAVASRQLTDTPKLESGKAGIQLFCVPNASNGHQAPTAQWIMREHQEEWIQFGIYCGVDARAGRLITEYAERLYKQFDAPHLMARENMLELITWEMNSVGWKVDTPIIEKMSVRAWANSLIEQRKFFLDTDTELNFNSPVQLKKYCADRGFRVTSLDKYQLPLAITRAEKMMAENATESMAEVLAMLKCKLELGGSSLSKLQKILDLKGEDDILRDQYIHAGAGQTFRTSGRGVQMQNLKRLPEVREMETVHDYSVGWSNTDLADQLRQVFTASHSDGELFVGDFSAVESRGLAYLAGEEWKLDAYREGLDVYKVLVTKYMGIEYADVTAEQRPRGKYSELSCGYQASGKAVQEYMFRLGFNVTLEDATQNVLDWRKANPKIIEFWKDLDNALRWTLEEGRVGRGQEFYLAYGQKVRIMPFLLDSIQEQHPGALSLMVQIWDGDEPIVNRVFHGCYFNGNSIVYYKPEERLRDLLWSDVNKTATAKQKKTILNTVYGGKLAGILTQSLCRELFYDSVQLMSEALTNVPNAVMVGSFHDEINIDWWPDANGIDGPSLKELITKAMTTCKLNNFPLNVEVKSAYRYIK